MRKIIILTLLVLCQYSWAGVRPEAKMRKIAAGKLLGNTSAASNLEILDEAPAYHIYGKDKQGFVIVSTDENAKEILGYSTTPYDKENLPPAFKYWLQTIEYATIDKTAKASYTVVPNFLTSTWGQNDPYNLLCPQISGAKTPSGCVATAMSQIMYYYKYPAQGKGSGYYTLGDSNTPHKEDIKGVYQWDKMYDDYSSMTLTDEIRTPVATLLRDAGLGSHMNYAVGGSGTTEYDAATSFVENFGYAANQIRICTKAYYSTEEYNSIIYSELAAKRPVFAVGADATQGGHAFIFSGVDADGKVYVNWGWNGSADGYYEMTTLNPKNILGNSSTMIFGLYNAVVVGIVPGTGDPSESAFTSQWISNAKPVFAPWDAFDYMEVTLGGIYNVSPATFKGQILLYFESTDGDHQKDKSYELLDTKDLDGGEVLSGYGLTFNNSIGFWSSNLSLQPGQYYVYLASKGENETTPQEFRYEGGKCRYLVTFANGVFTVEEYTPTAISSVYMAPETDNATRIFDLLGREVKTPQKGIYIINGKKVVK